MIKAYAQERLDGEHFGDFVIRKGIISATKSGKEFCASPSSSSRARRRRRVTDSRSPPLRRRRHVPPVDVARATLPHLSFVSAVYPRPSPLLSLDPQKRHTVYSSLSFPPLSSPHVSPSGSFLLTVVRQPTSPLHRVPRRSSGSFLPARVFTITFGQAVVSASVSAAALDDLRRQRASERASSWSCEWHRRQRAELGET